MATNWSNVTNAGDFLRIPNTNTGGWFWVSVLWMIFAIMLISMLPFGFTAAILAASFGCLVIGMILVYMNLVSWVWVIMFAGLIVGTFIWTMYSQKS